MLVIFISALLAILRLGLIKGALLLFAEIYDFVSATRALRHDFDLVVVKN
jgi:hypothetical protein